MLQPAPAIVSMDEWMARGDAAVQENDHTKARDAWRSAAKDYPTAKQPWLKLSEDYFNAADYGNAAARAEISRGVMASILFRPISSGFSASARMSVSRSFSRRSASES